jgi:nicotinate dehydrogenase subunit B
MGIKSVSRRQFVKATGALIVSFSFSGLLSRALGQSQTLYGGEPEATSLDSWVAVAQDGSVTIFTSKVDLGTGVVTALSQILADELDVPFEKIKMVTGDTATTIDQAATVASRTLERAGPQLRQAAAAARQQLLRLAAVRLETPVESLTVNDGVISIIGNSSKNISYGDVIGGRRFNVKITATGVGYGMKLAPEVPAKDPKNYKIVGTSVPRVDLPPKFTGEFTYTQDVRVPGMLHGRVVRPAVVSSKPLSIDESSVAKIPGIVKVVQQGNFVGVVGTTEWAAIQAARTLKVTWSTPSDKLPDGRDEAYAYLQNTKSFREQVSVNRGNPDSTFAQAKRVIEATYRWPFQLHGMLAPSCAVADVSRDKATIWAGTQGLFFTRKSVADMLGLPEKNVRVIYRECSGCYGRLEFDDVPEDAALMSRAVGKPVRVQWMREDEHGWESKGPAQLLTVRAGVDAQGKVTAWDFVDRSFPWTEGLGNPLLAARQIGFKSINEGNQNGSSPIRAGGEIYDFENQKIVAEAMPLAQPEPMPLRTSPLRAPGEPARCFASESHMDEIASFLRIDPVQFRLGYLTDKRTIEALLTASKQAGWQMRPSPAPASNGSKASGRGVAVANRDNAMLVAVAEVEIDRTTGQVAVKRVTMAHDCGLIVNPDGLRNQIEGNVIQGVSRALMEEVLFDESGIQNLNWASYPILRFNEIPEVEITLINQPDMQPLGAGEAGIIPVPAAIANAIFDAVGVRLREIPFTPQRVLSALSAGAFVPPQS